MRACILALVGIRLVAHSHVLEGDNFTGNSLMHSLVPLTAAWVCSKHARRLEAPAKLHISCMQVLVFTVAHAPLLLAGSHAAAEAAAQPHPVWGVPSPAVAGYIKLLRFLCGEELMRLRVWVEPLRHAEAPRPTQLVSGCGCTQNVTYKQAVQAVVCWVAMAGGNPVSRCC